MKKNLILTGLLVLVTTVAQATVYDSGTVAVGATIPDNNPSGYASSFSFVTGDVNAINGVSVTLNISGGYNGDLYGYLVNPNGDMAVLLNRVGQTGGSFGYSDPGMNVILSDVGMPGAASLAGNIHTYGAGDITSGLTAWSPDNGTQDFSALHTGTIDGQWTLFLADLSSTDQSMLVSWDLNVSVVPEPVTWALLLFGAGMALLGLARWYRAQQS